MIIQLDSQEFDAKHYTTEQLGGVPTVEMIYFL